MFIIFKFFFCSTTFIKLSLKFQKSFAKVYKLFLKYEGCCKSLAQHTLAPKRCTQLARHKCQCIMWGLTNKMYEKFFPNNVVQICQWQRRPRNLFRLYYKKQWQVYIKIKCSWGNTEPLITANLCEACSHDAANCSTVAQQFKQFQEGRRSKNDDECLCRPSTTTDNISTAIVSTYLKDRQNDSVRYGKGIRFTENNDTPHFNGISDEKGCGVGVPHMLFPTRKQCRM